MSVLNLLDTQLDPREVEKAKEVQMATLVEKEFAVPRLEMKSSEGRIAAGSHAQT